MSDYPTYVIINDNRYDINTDFRVALKCDKISRDKTIGDLERCLAVIYELFGEKGIKAQQDHEKLLNAAKKFLSCGSESVVSDEPADMDYNEDFDYIEASFMSDYHIDLSTEKMHWWKFYKLINGLSNSEIGNCCVLNRIRNIRNIDPRTIKDPKEREKIIKVQQQVALKQTDQRFNLTEQQEESMRRLDEIIYKKR